MILLYCDDVAKRRSVHNYFRDKGVLIEASPINEFVVRSYACDISALLIVGRVPPGFASLLCPDVPLISVSQYQIADSIHFRDYESRELFEMLLSFGCAVDCFEYNGILKATPRGVVFLGYDFNLTPTERSILAFLVSRIGGDASAEEIAEVCLGDIHSKRSAVAKHISSINQKAHAIGGRNMILSTEYGNYAINKYA